MCNGLFQTALFQFTQLYGLVPGHTLVTYLLQDVCRCKRNIVVADCAMAFFKLPCSNSLSCMD